MLFIFLLLIIILFLWNLMDKLNLYFYLLFFYF